jgi:hypothetical protein
MVLKFENLPHAKADHTLENFWIICGFHPQAQLAHPCARDVGVRLCRRKRLETDYYFLNGRRKERLACSCTQIKYLLLGFTDCLFYRAGCEPQRNTLVWLLARSLLLDFCFAPSRENIWKLNNP